MAYPSELTLSERLRAGHVRRWHIVAVSREQTIADHMHRVGVITHAILETLGLLNWDSSLTLNAMEWARVHDLPEVTTGDIPTNGKALLKQHITADEMHALEANISRSWGELAMCVATDGECPLAGKIVKVADLVEAANYCGIFGVGDHARTVYHGLRSAAHQALQDLIEYDEDIRFHYAALHNLLGPIIDSRPA